MAQKVTITTTADTYVYCQNPSTNYNGDTMDTYLYLPSVDLERPKHRYAIMRFDLTDLANMEIKSAIFKFQASAASSSYCFVRVIPDTGWDETTVTYDDLVNFYSTSPVEHSDNNQYPIPTYYGYEFAAKFVPSAGSRYIDKDFNVSVDIAESINKHKGEVVDLIVETGGQSVWTIYSKDNVSSKASPRIEIAYQAPATYTSPAGATQIVTGTAEDVTTTIHLNPYSGLYKWRGSEINTNFTGHPDVYQRFNWDDIETSLGTFVWSSITTPIGTLSAGQKYHVRLRAMGATSGNSMPAYAQSAPYSQLNGAEVLPNWNDSSFLARVEALYDSMQTALDAENRLGFIDIGIYGKLGEWQMEGYSATYEANAASEQAMADSIILNLPNHRCLILYNMSQSDWALNTRKQNTYGLIGTRADSMGNYQAVYMSNILKDSWRSLQVDSWKRAPLVTEYWNSTGMDKDYSYRIAKLEAQALHATMTSNGNSYTWASLSTQQRQDWTDHGISMGAKLVINSITFTNPTYNQFAYVDFNVSNLGNVPVYEPYTVNLKLTNTSGGSPTQTFSMVMDIRSFLPTKSPVTSVDQPLVIREPIKLTSTTAGTYKVEVQVVDPASSNKRNPLYLYNAQTRDASGWYDFGNITIS